LCLIFMYNIYTTHCKGSFGISTDGHQCDYITGTQFINELNDGLENSYQDSGSCEVSREVPSKANVNKDLHLVWAR
jgi:hypothetical protein